MNKFLSMASTLAFVAAFALAALAVAEGLAQLAGHSIVHRLYSAGRLFEFATMAMVFAIGLLLREIRDALRKA